MMMNARMMMKARVVVIMIKDDDIAWVTRRRWQRCSKVRIIAPKMMIMNIFNPIIIIINIIIISPYHSLGNLCNEKDVGLDDSIFHFLL